MAALTASMASMGSRYCRPMPAVRTPDGNDVAAYDFGGRGPALVLAHATGFHARVWLPAVERLTDAFHCYGFDARGHGDSEPAPLGDYRWSGFATDVLAVIEHFGLDRPLAAGHSSGGALLVLAEERRPGTFAGLWCYEPIILPSDDVLPPSAENPLSGGARKRQDRFESFDAAFDNYRSKPPFDRLDHQALRAYVDHGLEDDGDGGLRLKCRPEDEARMYEMMPEHGAFRGMADVRCPVALNCGSETDAFGEPVIKLLAARLPEATVEVHPGLGHFGPMEDPAAVAASIRRAFGA